MTPLLLAPLLSLASAGTPLEVSLDSPSDTAALALPVRIVEVVDRRILGAADSQALGATGRGLFEERAALRTPRSVRTEVQALLSRWLRPDSSAPPVRLELMAFEAWTIPARGPDPARSRVVLRVVSADSAKPGLLLAPESQGERKGLNTPAQLAALLREGLRDALGTLRPGLVPVPDSGGTPPAPDGWTHPDSTPAPKSSERALRQDLALHLEGSDRVAALGLRYGQSLEPEMTWNRTWWGGLQLRGPWNDDRLEDVWSGELLGGLAWSRRFEGGASALVFQPSLGGIVGFERFRRAGDSTDAGDREVWSYLGAEAKAGLRYQPAARPGPTVGVGASLALRVPSVVAWWTPSLWMELGYRV